MPDTAFARRRGYFRHAGLGPARRALIAAIGILFLGEPLTALKVASIALIVAGVVGLNLAGAH